MTFLQQNINKLIDLIKTFAEEKQQRLDRMEVNKRQRILLNRTNAVNAILFAFRSSFRERLKLNIIFFFDVSPNPVIWQLSKYFKIIQILFVTMEMKLFL